MAVHVSHDIPTVDRRVRLACSTTSAHRCFFDADLADYPLATDLRNQLAGVLPHPPSVAADRRRCSRELILALARRARRVIFRDAFLPRVGTGPARLFAIIDVPAQPAITASPLSATRANDRIRERRAEAFACRPRGVRRLLLQLFACLTPPPTRGCPVLPVTSQVKCRQLRWHTAVFPHRDYTLASCPPSIWLHPAHCTAYLSADLQGGVAQLRPAGGKRSYHVAGRSRSDSRVRGYLRSSAGVQRFLRPNTLQGAAYCKVDACFQPKHLRS